jgi:hypothetical protein
LAPLVANSVSGLSLDIVDAMLTVKELVLSGGTLFEPLGAVGAVDEVDDPQAAAIRLTPAANPTQPTRPKRPYLPWPCEREARPPLPLLPRRITHAPFTRRHPNKRNNSRWPSSALQPGQGRIPCPFQPCCGRRRCPDIRPSGINTVLTSWPPRKNTMNGGAAPSGGWAWSAGAGKAARGRRLTRLTPARSGSQPSAG